MNVNESCKYLFIAFLFYANLNNAQKWIIQAYFIQTKKILNLTYDYILLLYQLRRMNLLTPISNIIITVCILLFLLIGLLVLKYSYKTHPKNKYSLTQILTWQSQKNDNPQDQNQEQPNRVKPVLQFSNIVKSFLFKYTIIGSIINPDKKYLLKQMFIIALFVGCVISGNKIIIWPIAVGLCGFVLTYFLYQHIFRLKISHEEQQTNKIRCQGMEDFNKIIQGICQAPRKNQDDAQNIAKLSNRTTPHKTFHLRLEPVSIPSQLNLFDTQQTAAIKSPHQRQVKVSVKTQSSEKTSYIINISLACISFTMSMLLMSSLAIIATSLSNIGLLNLQSVLIMFLIDQLPLRLGVFGIIIGFSYFIEYAGLKPLYENHLILALCYEELQHYKKENQNNNAQMGASPPRRKEVSPSRIPKIKNPNISDSIKLGQQVNSQLDLLHLQPTNRSKKSRSIKSKSKQSQIRQDGTGQQANDELSDIEQISITDHSPKVKGKQKYSYSAQRPIKVTQSILKDHNFNDDLVLVDNGLNYLDGLNYRRNNENHFGQTDLTIDINFSPTTKRKGRSKTRKNKRQMIITGSSPYLQYLPDMMKKVERNMNKRKQKIKLEAEKMQEGIQKQKDKEFQEIHIL